MRMRRLFASLLFTASALVPALTACSSDAVGIDGCRKIEEARCVRATECGLDLSKPVHEGKTPEADVKACVRFYRDACLHGMPSDPGVRETDACVSAIGTGSCDVVLRPEQNDACRFLNATDAGTTPADATQTPTPDASGPVDAAAGG
jgi:hypothetical protein